MQRASSRVNDHCCRAGSSWPKKVSASATCWSKAPAGPDPTRPGSPARRPPQEGIDGPNLVARTVQLDGVPKECS